MQIIKNLAAVLLIALFAASCSSKGEPSVQGELLTIEQITNLPEDGSWNDKLIAIDGYAGFCKRMSVIKIDKYNMVSITSEADCGGETLIQMEIGIKSAKDNTLATFGGETPRNFITVDPDEKTNRSMRFMTDDYSDEAYGKFRFSGKLTFDSEKQNYHLTSVTIHKL